jgi:hypothetical protein
VQAQKKSDVAIAAPTQNRTPRVGIVLSSFSGGEDHFGGTKFAGLPEPKAVNVELTDAQLRAMTRRAIELGSQNRGSLERIVTPDDLVVLLVNRDADPAMVRAVIDLLREHKRGERITIVTPDPAKYPDTKAVDPKTVESMQMPAPGTWSRRDVLYRVPKVILECDRLISIAPLRITGLRPSLAFDNYRTIIPTPPVNAGTADLVAMDLVGFHVPDYAVLGGTRAFRNRSPIRHNLVVAGPIVTAVDSVGAAILGVDPQKVPLLQLANKRGFGDPDPNVIWMRGNEVEEARLK